MQLWGQRKSFKRLALVVQQDNTTYSRYIFSLVICLASACLNASSGEWEHELDAYYTNIAYFKTLDDSPIPELGKRSEVQVYPRPFFFRSYFPRLF